MRSKSLIRFAKWGLQIHEVQHAHATMAERSFSGPIKLTQLERLLSSIVATQGCALVCSDRSGVTAQPARCGR